MFSILLFGISSLSPLGGLEFEENDSNVENYKTNKMNLKIECRNKKIIICSIVKNAAKGFHVMKSGVTELVKHFNDYAVIIYENNSVDTTKQLYCEWASENSKVNFYSEDLTECQIDNLVIKKGDYRVGIIARARNIVLRKAFESVYDDFDYVLMVDSDNFDFWDIQGIVDTIENPQYEWDMVAANGSYDIYALRSDDFFISMELLGYEKWASLLPVIGEKFADILSSKKWYKVDSAFGGMALYKKNRIRGCYYSPLVDQIYIDYLQSKKFRKDYIFKKISKPTITYLKKNFTMLKLWNNSEYSIKFLPDNPYICEHISLHLQMKKEGADKLYVNPNWRYDSLEHTNYHIVK